MQSVRILRGVIIYGNTINTPPEFPQFCNVVGYTSSRYYYNKLVFCEDTFSAFLSNLHFEDQILQNNQKVVGTSWLQHGYSANINYSCCCSDRKLGLLCRRERKNWVGTNLVPRAFAATQTKALG